MDLLATIIVAAAAVELLSGLLYAVAFVRRPTDREHGLAALLSLAAAAHAVGTLVAAREPDARRAHDAAAVAWLGLVAVPPLVAHLSMMYRPAAPSRTVVVTLYLAAACCAMFDSVNGTPHATYGAALAATAGALVVVARAYLGGRREALAVVMGATVLLATLANDWAIAAGALTTGHLVDAGLATFLASIMSTRSARYAAVTLQLEQRTQELRTRTRELGRSYEELRAAQEELVKKEQLAVVGELAAVIAHEVRNPLAIIANAVAGLRRQAISRDDHETLLAILDEETSRLNRLVTDLLRYARPVNVQRSDFSLADVIERALTLVSKDRKAIKTELRLEGHDGRISGDPNLLRQVFDNLVVNAVQAMGAAGTLTVRVRPAIDEGLEGIAVEIIDTGEGMDTQVRSRARDPFFTTRPSGTGLGLAIVDRIVDAHGGRFSIASRAGEGTTVTVFLPTGSDHDAAPRAHSPRAGAGARAASGMMSPPRDP